MNRRFETIALPPAFAGSSFLLTRTWVPLRFTQALYYRLLRRLLALFSADFRVTIRGTVSLARSPWILFLESDVVDHHGPFLHDAFIAVHPDRDGR